MKDPTTTNSHENHDPDATIQELRAMLAAREKRIEQLEAELAAQQQQQQVSTPVAQELVEREAAARCALDEAEAVGDGARQKDELADAMDASSSQQERGKVPRAAP